jgi:hypothetical protein
MHFSKRFKKPFLVVTVLSVIAVALYVVAESLDIDLSGLIFYTPLFLIIWFWFSHTSQVDLRGMRLVWIIVACCFLEVVAILSPYRAYFDVFFIFGFCALLFLIVSASVCRIRHVRPEGGRVPLFIVGSLIIGAFAAYQPLAVLFKLLQPQVWLFHTAPYGFIMLLVVDILSALLDFLLFYLLLRFSTNDRARFWPGYLAVNPGYAILVILAVEVIGLPLVFGVLACESLVPASASVSLFQMIIAVLDSKLFFVYLMSTGFLLLFSLRSRRKIGFIRAEA